MSGGTGRRCGSGGQACAARDRPWADPTSPRSSIPRMRACAELRCSEVQSSPTCFVNTSPSPSNHAVTSSPWACAVRQATVVCRTDTLIGVSHSQTSRASSTPTLSSSAPSLHIVLSFLFPSSYHLSLFHSPSVLSVPEIQLGGLRSVASSSCGV